MINSRISASRRHQNLKALHR